ncbi:MAG: glycosyltransferase family 1 protein [Clostridia bacterium]
MKICFTCYLEEYKPKGNVLQFLNLLKAIDQKVDQLPGKQQKKAVIDCVLPFEFDSAKHRMSFRHVHFYKATNLAKKVAELDKKKNYDFLFVRGRKEAIDLLRENRKTAKKLLFLTINYNLNSPANITELRHIFDNSRVMFFQSVPLAERFKAYVCENGLSPDEASKKIGVLPQFVTPYPEQKLAAIRRAIPPQLIQVGVIRPRYGLSVAVRAIRLIRKQVPKARLHVLHPSIVPKYRKKARALLKRRGVKDHGMKSAWETKRMIVKNGIGLALIYDNTPDKTPSHAYLSRVLEYMSLGVPVITTPTKGNIHLLGQGYPLFVQDENDILRCYLKLLIPEFYQQMSKYVYQIGQQFLTQNAVNEFWSVLNSRKG